MTGASPDSGGHCPDCGRPVEREASLCVCGFPLMFLQPDEPEAAVLKPSRRPAEVSDDTDVLPVFEPPPRDVAPPVAPPLPFVPAPVDGLVCASCDEVNPTSRTWCAHCGAALRERRDLTEVLPTTPAPRPPRRALLIGGVVVAMLVVGGGAALAAAAWREKGEVSVPEERVLVVASVQASRTAPDGQESPEAGGGRVTYQADNVVDGDSKTAWRVEGSGVGDHLDLTLDGERLVTRVGLVPGYAKTDPGNQADRFAENGAVTQVRWIFDGETARVQDIAAPQPHLTEFAIEPPVSARTIRLEIVGSRPGTKEDRPTTAISEVLVRGR